MDNPYVRQPKTEQSFTADAPLDLLCRTTSFLVDSPYWSRRWWIGRNARIFSVDFLIETLLTPPFKSPPSYGQFLIVSLVWGSTWLSSVCVLGIVPFVTWIGYVPIHILGVFIIWSIDRQFFADVDWTEAPDRCNDVHAVDSDFRCHRF